MSKYQALPVEKIEMSFNEAIKKGAKAFFDEKYADIVRVVVVKWACRWDDSISIELCGGTHVDSTADIWAFKIIWQEAVASGIRRIIAVTWPKVAQYAIEKDKFIFQISDLFDTPPKQLIDKISKFLKEYDELKSKYKSLEEKLLADKLKLLVEKSFSYEKFDKIIKLSNDSIFENINFKQLGEMNIKFNEKMKK